MSPEIVIDWIAPSLGNPIVYSLVSFADKAVLTRFGLGVASFNFFVGLSQLVISIGILLVNPLPAVGVSVIVGGLSAGLLHGAGLVLMFWVLRKEEVSRVVPVAQTSPIFVALIAVFALGERLGPAQWLAVVLAVAGAALVSVRRNEGGSGFALRGSFVLLALSALLVGGAQLLIKVTTEELSVWHTLALRGAGLAAVMCLPFARPTVLAELGRFLLVPKRAAFIVTGEMLLPLAGNLLLIAAIARGPVSLASALIGTRPIFVFAGSLIGSRFAPTLVREELGPLEIAVKLASAGMVVAAVILIAAG